MKFHPDVELLLKYCSGSLHPALSFAIGMHVKGCSTCQALVADFEFAGGQILESMPHVEVDPNGLDAIFDKIDNDQELTRVSDLAVANEDQELLNALLNQDFDQFKWEKVTGKISKTVLALNDEQFNVELLKFAPNANIPKHTHKGNEYTVVLSGDFRDKNGYYRKGEFIALNDEHEHQPIAGPDGCICLAITDDNLKFTGTFGPILNMVIS